MVELLELFMNDRDLDKIWRMVIRRERDIQDRENKAEREYLNRWFQDIMIRRMEKKCLKEPSKEYTWEAQAPVQEDFLTEAEMAI